MSKNTWRDYPLWLKALPWELTGDLRTPEDVAEYECSRYMSMHPSSAITLIHDDTHGEGYTLHWEERNCTVHGSGAGLLYGFYDAVFHARVNSREEVDAKPRYALRMINCWDNMDGSIERGYAGRSMWFEGSRFVYDPDRIRQLGRLLASVHINVLCINNVNVQDPAGHLLDTFLPDLAGFADILRPFGVRVMISIDFAMPILEGMTTADPLDPAVEAWWGVKADKIYEAIPDFAGFLVKADSEHRPGPNAYGRNHAEGANMLAKALAPHGGVVVWRAFVYNCKQDWRDQSVDRPKAAYDLYHPMDGQFAENVILQIKNGPFDFQVREPVSPLFYGMPHTRLALEFQLTQEYTGHQVDIYAMPPLFEEVMQAIPENAISAIAGVSNLGRDSNWTGHPFAALNLFAYGRTAFHGTQDSKAVTDLWLGNTYPDLSSRDRKILHSVLLHSRIAYERYTAPLGLCWMVNPHGHYGCSPYGYEFDVWGTYNRADRFGVGIDRTSSGTGYTLQYPEHLQYVYENRDLCPDNLVLFFHRLPYDAVLHDGNTLIQRIYEDHFQGLADVEEMKRLLDTVQFPEEDAEEVHQRMEMQLHNAREWCDIINTFFYRFSGIPDQKGRVIYP